MEKTEKKKKKVTLICSRSTLDGVYPPLILALQAARAGADALVFFTFDGMNAVKKGGLDNHKYYPPGLLGAIPGIPSMAGQKMVKLAEEKANIPTPREIFEMCRLEGVKFYGCRMTMDMMGIKDEELIEGVNVTNSEGYIKMALSSDVNMFV
ncbi:MAG: DsrE/DsrF/DrsH-like family protein [Bacillota bacterium]